MERVHLDGKTACGHDFRFVWGNGKHLDLTGKELWDLVNQKYPIINDDRMVVLPRVIEEALERFQQKALEHNNEQIGFKEYCPFGDASAASYVHREALRVCACITQNDTKRAWEHLVDVVVFAILMSSLPNYVKVL